MAMLIGMPPKNIISPAILNHAATPAIASAVINVRIPNSIHIFIAILNSALWLWQIKLYINTSMIKLERVKNRVIADQNDPKHQLGHPLTGRGIIDSFLPSSEKTLYSFISDTTADTLGKRFIELAKQNDIHIATQFGVEGADLMSLLDADVDIEHTWFETSLINGSSAKFLHSGDLAIKAPTRLVLKPVNSSFPSLVFPKKGCMSWVILLS